MPQKVKDIHHALTSKGFIVRESKDKMYHLYVEGKKTPIWTKVSQGETEVHDALLGTMARKQLHLSRKDFDRLIECPLSAAEYVTMMRKAGKIAPPAGSNERSRDQS
ncbi:MAG: hypothetical protein HEQ23_13570 [Tepidisphaera sp.]